MYERQEWTERRLFVPLGHVVSIDKDQHKTTPTASQILLIEARLGTNKGLSVEIQSRPTGIVNLFNGKKVSPEPRGTKNVFSDIRVCPYRYMYFHSRV